MTDQPNIKYSPIFYPTQEIEISSCVHLLVVPVGKISATTFKYYLDQIKKVSMIQRESLNLQTLGTSQNKQYNDGNISLKYLDGCYVPNEWSDFHLYKKVFGIIGISHFPKSPNFKQIYSDFISEVDKFKTNGPFISRCFSFDPPENIEDPMLSGFYPIPMVTTIEHLYFYLERLIADMLTELISQFRTEMKIPLNKIETISIQTDKSKTNSDNNILKKLKLARRKKTIADYHLLSGEYKDSEDLYTNSMIQFNNLSDTMFYACSFENLCCIKFKIEQLKNKNGKLSEKIVKEINDDLKKIIELYEKKKIFVLIVEVHLRLAHFLLKHGARSDRNQIIESLSSAYSYFNNFDPVEQILLVKNLVSFYSLVGYKRKVSFFLRQTALCHQKFKNWQIFHDYLLYSCKYFQLEELLELIENDNKNEGVNHDTSDQNQKKKTNPKKQKSFNDLQKINKWTNLQKTILFDLLKATRYTNNYKRFIQYCIFILKIFYKTIPTEKQLKLFQNLKLVTSYLSMGTEINMYAFPPVESIKLINSNIDGDEPIKIQKEKNQDIFIFTPKEQKKQKKSSKGKGNHKNGNSEDDDDKVIDKTCNELINFEIIVSNPFDFDLILERVSLVPRANEKENFIIYPLRITLPSNTKRQSIVLAIKALKPINDLQISFCEICLLGIKYLHPLQLNERINVIPPLPKMIISISSNNYINTYEEQIIDNVLKFENVGKKIIYKIKIDKNIIREKIHKYPKFAPYEQYYATKILDWDNTIIEENLPLLPGESFYLPFKLCARKYVEEIQFLVKYYGNYKNDLIDNKDLDEYYHLIKIPFRLNTKASIQILSFELIKNRMVTDSNNLKRDSYLIIAEFKNLSKFNFVLNCKVRNNDNLRFYHLNKNKNKNTKGKMGGLNGVTNDKMNNIKKTKYIESKNISENNDEQSSIHSKLTKHKLQKIKKIQNMPNSKKLKINNVQNKNITINRKKFKRDHEKYDESSIEVMNNKYEYEREIIIESHCEKRIIIPISNFNLPEEDISGIPPEILLDHYLAINHYRPNKKESFELMQKNNIKCLLLQKIEINWVSNLQNFGEIPLYSMQISQSTYNILKPSQYLTSVRLPNYIELFKFYPIKLSIKNITSETLTLDFVILFESGGNTISNNFYHIHSNFLKTPEKKLLWVGALSMSNIKLLPDSVFEHQIVVSFLIHGQYLITVKGFNKLTNKSFILEQKMLTIN
ncbi:trafficking protein particle complex subunit [Anaeramoeba flamelloides]|uniref:Trafficking protein particle complex subunit n=1 Tax=Anaeramoeba flamelloides TaxID=1746091 RepID=A0AAV7Z4M1_9EUKA|nr:trafficking protein particle complex subunit [Anaeramoeba flamelloides]